MRKVKLSRYAVEMSIQCQRCFYLHYKHKIRMDSFPFTLNMAVDNLVKNEFDIYRREKKPHPLFKEIGIDAVPFNHPNMDKWRNNFQGAYFDDDEKGYSFGGAVDDLWLQSNGKLIVSDVKATAKTNFNWEETCEKYEYPKAYKRQIEMYQFVFRRLGFEVDDVGFLLYFNGLRNNAFFEHKLLFDHHLIKLNCCDDWVEEAILKARKLLLNDELPPSSDSCDKCNYLKARWNLSKQ